jgi:hypothetical protein
VFYPSLTREVQENKLSHGWQVHLEGGADIASSGLAIYNLQRRN